MIHPMDGTRATWWIRWPDREVGPLWAGLHVSARGGHAAVVGLEVWTEPPGEARATLGPVPEGWFEGEAGRPVSLRGADLGSRLAFPQLVEDLRTALVSVDPEVAGALEGVGAGRPKSYDLDHYERVAGVYLRANPRRRSAEVAEVWRVSVATAKGWVATARQMGLIEAA